MLLDAWPTFFLRSHGDIHDGYDQVRKHVLAWTSIARMAHIEART